MTYLIEMHTTFYARVWVSCIVSVCCQIKFWVWPKIRMLTYFTIVSSQIINSKFSEIVGSNVSEW